MIRRSLASGALLFLAVQGISPGLTAPAKAKIDPKADQVLKDMGAALAAARGFSLEADESFDEVLPTGQKVQYSNLRRVSVQRPDRAAAEISGDTANVRLVYDGKTITVFETKKNAYAQAPAPPNLEAALDHAAEKLHLTLPLADFVFGDPYKTLTEHVEAGYYLGERNVGGTACHHLAFTQRKIDWQLWVETGARPLPRKLVISYKSLPAHPQYVAVLRDWNLNPRFPASTFQFQPPAGAMKVEFFRPEMLKKAAATKRPPARPQRR